MKNISSKTKIKIIELYTKDKEVSKKVIAEKCKVSRSFVYKIINKNAKIGE